MKRITNGELKTMKHCRRRWWLTWHRRLRPQRPRRVGAAPLGTRMHSALQAHYSPTDERDPFVVLEETITRDSIALADDYEALMDLQKEAELARIMLEGYFEWLEETGVDQGLVVVAAEERVEAPFPALPGVNVMGKLDVRMYREMDGARLFMDHKNVASLVEATKMLHLDEQMLHYHLLEHLDYLQRLGPAEAAEAPHSVGGLYNLLRKIKRSVRAKPPFYDRVEIPHNVHQLRSYYIRVYGEVLTILDMERRLEAGEDHRVVAYPSPTKDCTWKCEFLGVCPIFDESPEAAEHFIADWFVEADPLDRYQQEERSDS